MMKKLKFKTYLSLVTFSHTIFALPFALLGFFLAIKYGGYSFDWKIFLFMIACMVLARNAAMGFNRYADREIDKKNPRTANREIPSGKISSGSALVFVIVNSLAFIACTYFINSLVFYLSPLALLIVLGYSVTKRFTAICHFILGLGLSLAPIGAYLTLSAEFNYLPLIYSIVVLTWVSGFDIIYSLQDDYFDKSESLKSIPVAIGRKNALGLSAILHVFSAAGVIIAGVIAGFVYLYFAGSLIFIALLIYQHSLVKIDDLSKVKKAFFTTNGIASLIFATFSILDLYLFA